MKINSRINNFFKHNSPTILTAVGCVGVGITAIMAARDTVKAIKRINYERGYQLKEFNTKEKIKIATPCYIPTVLTGLSTMLCICGANKLNKNMQKSLTSAYVLLDQSYKEYRNSVREVHGDEGDIEVIKNISNKKVAELNIDGNDDIFFDFFSLQFFNSSLPRIYEAEKAANEILQSHGYISLKTVYSLIGEDIIGTDDLLGWSLGAGEVYDYDRVELNTHEMIREDGTKYYVLDFGTSPTEDYLHLL